MSGSERFHEYVADVLAAQLPYRKKYLMFGPQVCEWGLVLHMCQSAFFIGCAAGLDDPEGAISLAGAANDVRAWGALWSSAGMELERRVSAVEPSSATFDQLFPETFTQSVSEVRRLLSPRECVAALGEPVVTGLTVALGFPELAQAMLDLRRPIRRGAQIVGVRLIDASAWMTVEQMMAHAREMVAAWKSDTGVT